MKAVIMAGGEGSRLRPLTCTRPKPMVPVMDRPCMEYIVDLLRSHNIKEVGVTLQYLPENITEYFGDGSEFGVNLRYFVEDLPLGTAGSVKNAASFLDETFIVISGDALTDCDLEEAYEFHRRKGALATLVLTSVSCPLEYGVVITDRDGRITRFLEKPGWGEVFSDTVNTGIYILEPRVLDYIPKGKMVDFSKDLYPALLAKGEPLYAFVTRKYWCDIGSIEAYLQANCDLFDRKAGFLPPGEEVMPGVWCSGKAEIDPSAQINPPVYIGEGAVVESGAEVGPYAVLGRGVRVRRHASLKKSVVWDNSVIGEGAELRGAVVGSGVCIKASASLFEGVAVGDRTVVGERSTLKSGVKVWPEKRVERGVMLSSSLVWGSCARSRLFGADGISGDPGAEISADLACRIGAAVGSVAKLPARYALSTDSHVCSLMMKNALAAGLMATGVQVIDLGRVTAPVHRYGIRTLRLNGGIHISTKGDGKVDLRLFNHQGIEYSRDEQRKVEGMLSREEYRLVGAEEIPAPENIPELSRSYLHFLLEFVDKEAAKGARLRAVVDYDPERLGFLVPPLLEQLGCKVVTFSDRRWSDGWAPPAVDFGSFVKEQRADFGAVLEPGGEEIVLFDDRGEIVDRESLTALLSLFVLSGNEQPTIVLPVTAPDALDEMIRERGGKVLRVKTAPWSLMQAFLAEDVLRSQRRCPQFLLFRDALAILAVLVEFLARWKKPLSAIIQELPKCAIARRDVEVRWDEKGKVLRFLAEEAGDRPVEMIEGIKMYHPQGWTLVLPDADEPLCRVYSQGFNQEIAESLTEMCVERIRRICEESAADNPATV
ncbi:MAG: sugar phosphate nucleotidyltransferase [Thermacetogeniaceae bacterium]